MVKLYVVFQVLAGDNIRVTMFVSSVDTYNVYTANVSIILKACTQD